MRVYPRVCGGTFPLIHRYHGTTGLSPRVRGNLYRVRRSRPISRSIPACAGEPPGACPGFALEAVYPRVCGGTESVTAGAIGDAGLSPRVRGNRSEEVVRDIDPGSIPACAGEPSPYDGDGEFHAVYPRVCGGTGLRSLQPRDAGGLSPRVRGNRRSRRHDSRRAGSIPACAGEPAAARGSRRSGRVYPRVCGGTVSSSIVSASASGLSPRVRGNQLERGEANANGGSIPACAGEPVSDPYNLVTREVYPRVCGGTGYGAVGCWAGEGLSPRVRGNPADAALPADAVRSIPACAGEPRTRRPRGRATWVYPRVCGGTAQGGYNLSGYAGLSPRVRGNRRHCPSCEAGQRSIPACAGEPPR